MKPYLNHVRLKAMAYWYKHQTNVLLAVVVVCLAGSMLLLAYQSNQLKQQALANKNYNTQQLTAIKKVVDQINGSSKTRTAQLQDLTKHIDCIATFFAQPDRSQIVLKNLDKCIIASTQSNTPSSTAPKASTGATSSPPAAQNSQSGQSAQPPAKQPTAPPTQPKNCTIDLLSFHLLCP